MSERERDKSKLLHHAGVQCDSSFNELLPRPWVPGEERAHCQSDIVPVKACPPPQPRRSSHYSYSDGCVAPLGYEPEGSARLRDSRESPGANTVPACLRWARALPYLLEDSDGVSLFRRYLQAEGRPHADALDFWFACEGLRSHAEPEKQQQLVKAIYRRFFIKSSLPIGDELRRDVARRFKDVKNSTQRLDTVFDAAQAEVETLISNTTYSNFLKSDMYLQYVQAMQNPSSSDLSSGSGSSSSSSSISARDMALLTQGCGPLPTLHEDSELVTSCSSHHTPVLEPVRLTKDMLLQTQKRRLDVRPKPEAYAGMFAMRINGPPLGSYHHPHATYSSYNPVSRQDSELQSLSSHSDARTESDNMSLTDSSLDGMSAYRPSRKQSRQASRQARELAALNRDPYIHQTLIPRTQRIDSKQCQPLQPAEFASILIEKLENVKREQDAQDKLEKKLLEGECGGGGIEVIGNEEQSRTLADAIRLKLNFVDDDVQDILDAHVSRVWADLTPSRSPGLLSPRAHSPSRRHGTTRSRRKDRDVFSTFSSDSGNVHDFPDTTSLGKCKSTTRPDQAVSRRSASKKTLTDLTDSGVSVVSDTPPVPLSASLPSGKDSRVLTWLLESDRPSRSHTHTHSELSSGKHSRHRRSSSVERSGGGSEPAQPFVADPNMPPLPPPHTATQLEEARRRLLEDESRARRPSNQSTLKRCGTSSRNTRSSGPLGALAPSTTQTLPTAAGASTSEPPPITTEFTTVIYSFCDEQFPYLTKIPGTRVTLRQFKEYLPKKGNYRYFFKTECEELDNQVIQQEISCDTDLLPLWEGKVIAQVKPIE